MEEEIIVLYEDACVRVERIVSRGAVTKDGFWYMQTESEHVFVTRGDAELQFGDGSTVRLSAGQSYTLAPQVKHRVSYTTADCEWICVFIK